MKKLILSVTAIAGLAMAGQAQQVLFSDSGTQNGSIDTQINGVNNTTQDLNLELLVGSGGAVTTDVVTLLLSETTATATSALGTIQPGAGDITGTGGDILDKTINPYLVPAGTTEYQVLAWLGNSPTYAGAATKGETGILTFSTAPAAGAPPVTLDLDANGGPINLVAVPEPSTLAMAGVGLASMLMFRRKNK